jgi:hypothetical protein
MNYNQNRQNESYNRQKAFYTVIYKPEQIISLNQEINEPYSIRFPE